MAADRVELRGIRVPDELASRLKDALLKRPAGASTFAPDSSVHELELEDDGNRESLVVVEASAAPELLDLIDDLRALVHTG